MFLKKTLCAVCAALALGVMGEAAATVITLDFEGVGDFSDVGDFYNGGAGTNYGVSFSPATLAIVDEDAGGSGNFANRASPNTILFFLDANNAILNFAAGFQTGFAFAYSSSIATTVDIYDDVNGTGNILASLNLAAQGFDNCIGDPTGVFCNWTDVGALFSGTAKSVNFSGTAIQVGFDDITFGSDRPGQQVPEPESLALVGLGLAVLAATRRRKAA